MKKLLALFLLVPALAFGQVINRLTQYGCDFTAAYAACATEETNKKVKEGFCRESLKAPLNAQKEQLPTADFSMIEAYLEQEYNKAKVLKMKNPQAVFNSVQEACYDASGDLTKLINKGV